MKIEADKFYFKGIGGSDKKLHELSFEFYKEVEPDKSLKTVRDRNIEVVLKKKDDSSAYWPRLTKDKIKNHWLKIDFNRWQDDEYSDDDASGMNMGLEDMVRSMGGLGGSDAKPSFDDIDVPSDSDDEDLPDLE
ncbi:hypothetical protein AAG570_005156 [Ranatra chinensis]|uniref:CS domain-containing protein n=1 Tax=Ranatra chinensis TaxID=642074 RepID=A0ABD0YLF5_9HEMI